jgi:hypothetical protein
MRSRTESLRALIEYDLPIEPTLRELAEHGWDSKHELVVLERTAVLRILQRYLDGELSADEVADWADLVECREDIGTPEGRGDVVSQVIFRLANPNINGEITRQVIEQIQALLKGATSAI